LRPPPVLKFTGSVASLVTESRTALGTPWRSSSFFDVINLPAPVSSKNDRTNLNAVGEAAAASIKLVDSRASSRLRLGLQGVEEVSTVAGTPSKFG